MALFVPLEAFRLCITNPDILSGFWICTRLCTRAVQKLEEAKREARRRGEQKTQTSDAKFDEKFQVGHGLSGEANKPWYAKSGSMLQSEEAAPLQVISQTHGTTQMASTHQK